jgi:PAS domain S-box-containing protein
MRPTDAEAAAHFRLLAESCEDAIVCVNPSAEVSVWSRAAERIVGFSKREALGEPILTILRTDGGEALPDLLERIRRGDSPGQTHAVLLRKDGSGVDVRLALFAVPADGGEGHAGILFIKDVSDTAQADQELERAIRSSEHFDAASARLGRFAHQINNPLGGILMAAQFALANRNHPDSRAMMMKALKEIEEDARRCGDIVRRILQPGAGSQEADPGDNIELPLAARTPEKLS